MKNLRTHVSNYTYLHMHFPYSTVTSACQGSGLACTRTVSIFRTLTYMQMHFRHQNKPSTYVSELNKYSKSIILPTYTCWYCDLWKVCVL